MTEKPKFTSGPWSLMGDTVYALHDPDSRRARNRFWAHVQGDPTLLPTAAPEMQANAALIAAAPEMYEALRQLVTASSAPEETGESARRTIAAIQKARAAIAKAEGRS